MLGKTPSLIRKVDDRAWSARIRCDTSVRSDDPWGTPLSSPIRPSRRENSSVSQTESTPSNTLRMRSKPAPVSMEGAGSDVMDPSSCCSNCMNTRFQISMNRSSPPWAGPPSSPKSGPLSQKISEQGPHGPVSAIRQ